MTLTPNHNPDAELIQIVQDEYTRKNLLRMQEHANQQKKLKAKKVLIHRILDAAIESSAYVLLAAMVAVCAVSELIAYSLAGKIIVIALMAAAFRAGKFVGGK